MRLLVGIACAWAAGVACEGAIHGAVLGWTALVLLLGAGAVVSAARRWRRLMVGGVVALALAGGGLSSALHRAQAAHVLGWSDDEQVFEGRVVRPVEDGPDWRRVVVDARPVRGGATARVQVTYPRTAERAPLPGDLVRFAGAARAPRGYWNEGAFDRGRLLHGRGIARVVTARPPGVVRVDAPALRGVVRLAAEARQALASDAAAGHSSGHDDGAALVQALVLGRRGEVRPSVEDAFRRAGVAHVLSVSGLHLMAVAFLLYHAVRRLWLRIGWLAVRAPAERVAAAVAAPLAIAYTLITGAEIATVRALVCALIVLAGAALGRRFDALTALAAAALVILVDAPWALYEPSFQLSFVAAAALMTLAVRWSGMRAPGRAVPPPTRVRRALRWAWRLLIASLAASAATAPLTALHFGVVQPAGILANLVVVPAAELIVLPLGLVAVVLAAVVPVLGAPLLRLAGWAASALLHLVDAIAAYAPVIEVPPPRPLELAAFGIALLAAAVLRPARRAVLVAALACALAAGSCAITTFVTPSRRTALTVTFLDVGQGDAAVIDVPGGETWLIDAGGRLFARPGGAPIGLRPSGGRSGAEPCCDDELAAAITDPGEQAVWRFLRARRVRRLDVVVISHPHPDHYGGLLALAAHLPIGEVWIAGDAVDDPAWADLLAALAARGVTVRHPPAGLARERHGARLVVLAPLTADGVLAADEGRSVNDNSLVVRVEFAGRTVLFPGDLEGDGEETLLERAPAGSLPADVVKAPHHGSRTSSSPAFVAATRPHFVVISCGPRNRFKFPAPTVVARWEAAGARVLRTDQLGAITAVIAPDGTLGVTSYQPIPAE